MNQGYRFPRGPSPHPSYEDHEEVSGGSKHLPRGARAVPRQSWLGVVVPKAQRGWDLPGSGSSEAAQGPKGAGLGAPRLGRLKSADSQTLPQTLRTRISGDRDRRSGFSQCSQRGLRKEVPLPGPGTSPRAEMRQFCNSVISVSKRLQLPSLKNP